MVSNPRQLDSSQARMSDRAELFDTGSEATLSRKEDAMERDETEEHRYITSKRGRRNAERDINPNTGPGRSTIPTTSGWITTRPTPSGVMEDESSNREQSTDYDDLPELVPCAPDTTTDESSDEEREGDIEMMFRPVVAVSPESAVLYYTLTPSSQHPTGTRSSHSSW